MRVRGRREIESARERLLLRTLVEEVDTVLCEERFELHLLQLGLWVERRLSSAGNGRNK